MKTISLILCLTISIAASAHDQQKERYLNTTLSPIAFKSIQARNSISGYIFDTSRRAVGEIPVELLDGYGSTLGRAKTNNSGRYIFNNLSQGTFVVRVLPFGTDYEEEQATVSIQNFTLNSGSSSATYGSQSIQQDFVLKIRKSALAGPFYAPGIVFAQEVPDDARKLYEEAEDLLRQKKEKEAFENLKKALEIFPDYYTALDRLGSEYVVRGYYEAAYVLLTKSIEVNPRSFSSSLGLGLANYHLKQTDKAVELFRQATTLYNKSPLAHLWLGVSLKQNKKYDEAEAALKKANDLSKGKYPEAHWQLARLYSEQNKYKEAADSLELYLKYQSDTKDAEKIKQMIAKLRSKVS
jgi:tetratricopeptide (TPR) repeat protein